MWVTVSRNGWLTKYRRWQWWCVADHFPRRDFSELPMCSIPDSFDDDAIECCELDDTLLRWRTSFVFPSNFRMNFISATNSSLNGTWMKHSHKFISIRYFKHLQWISRRKRRPKSNELLKNGLNFTRKFGEKIYRIGLLWFQYKMDVGYLCLFGISITKDTEFNVAANHGNTTTKESHYKHTIYILYIQWFGVILFILLDDGIWMHVIWLGWERKELFLCFCLISCKLWLKSIKIGFVLCSWSKNVVANRVEMNCGNCWFKISK